MPDSSDYNFKYYIKDEDKKEAVPYLSITEMINNTIGNY
jgi:hypothetical protein